MSWLQVHFLATGGMAALPPALAACLPLAEHERALTLRRPQDRINRLAAYAALFRLVAAHTGLPAHELALQRDAHGKPHLQLPAGHAPLHVNLAHSGTWVAIALADGPVGVDIERVRTLDWRALRRAHFANDPWPDDADPLLALHQLWCSKEAVLKAAGMGLTLPLSQIVLYPPAQQFQHLRASPEDSGLERLQVALLAAPAGYAAAVAMAEPPGQLSVRRWVLGDDFG